MLPNGLRLRHLLTFVEVVRSGSVSRAASVLSVTQPAASKTLRELEEMLGAELFDRSRRGGNLTRFGEIFLRHAESSIAMLRLGFEQIGEARSAGAAPLRIGALPTVSARLLPLAVQSFVKTGVGAVPRIVTGPNTFLMSALRRGELDVVIGRMGEASEMVDLSFEHLYSEEIAFAVRPGHPLIAGARPFEPRRISEFEMLMPPPDAVIRPTVDALLLTAGISKPIIRIETVSTAFGRSYVRASDAIWVISEGVVLLDVMEGKLATLPLDTSQTLGPVGVMVRTDTGPSSAFEIFSRELRAAALRIRYPLDGTAPPDGRS